jgi:inosose dehydratase
MTHADFTKMGAQSFSFRNFDLNGAIQCLKELDLEVMEFCNVHFPPDPENPDLPVIKDKLRATNVHVCCFGVESYTGDADANRAKFEFAKALDIGILSADPAPEAFDNLEALCEAFQIKIAIHNHGPGARYDKVADTLGAVRNRHPFIGACVDTGHSIRSGEAPHEVIEALGDRVHSLHLKDWKAGGEEQILGEGDMDLDRVAQALQKIGFDGPIVMEFELSPDGPVPDMKKCMANWHAAVARL